MLAVLNTIAVKIPAQSLLVNYIHISVVGNGTDKTRWYMARSLGMFMFSFSSCCQTVVQRVVCLLF